MPKSKKRENGGKRGEVVGGVEEEWRRFKETILEVGEKVFVTKNIKEGNRRKGSECWGEEIRRVVGRQKDFFLNMEEDKE